MSRSWRAFYGAAIGALVVLFLHPASRPFMSSGFHWGYSKTFRETPLILSNHAVLPHPNSLLNDSLWMETGAQNLDSRPPLTKNKLDMLLEVARRAAEADPQNAYWFQMRALFANEETKRKDVPPVRRTQMRELAFRCWHQGAECARWDDQQTTRLRAIQKDLANEFGGPAAWQYAVVYPLRTAGPAEKIEGLGYEMIKGLGFESRHDLAIRYDTLVNGRLLRQGSRSLQIGQVGATLVEIASYPRELRFAKTPRKLILTRMAFYNDLQRAGMHDEADLANRTFQSNDAWLAFTRQQEISSHADQLRILSGFTITLPSALLLVSAVGGLLWLLSALAKWKPELLKIVEPPIAPAVGVVLSALVYSATSLVLPTLAVAGCFGFLAFGPTHQRSHAPEQLGTIFELVVFALGCILALFCSFFFIGLSTPAMHIFNSISGFPPEFYGGSTLWLGLAGMIIGLLLLAGVIWAISQRMTTSSVEVLAFRQLGKGIFLGCLTLAILFTPISLITDRLLQAPLGQLVANEPLYYYENQ